ncbi:MAG: endolytic transglycosylase MltG [Actinobacteria bacterium]|nr:endolytic transglycosylase MltG [Actinomycetota bacterium]
MRRLFLAGVLIVSLTFSLHLIRSQNRGAPDFPQMQISSQTKEVTVEIAPGSTGSDIAALLFDSGIVKSSTAFFRVAVGDARSAKIAPGAHRLALEISAQQALEQLLDAKRMPDLLVITEGAWNSEIVAELRSRGFSKADIDVAMKSIKLPTGFTSLEGILFPAQYSFPKGATASEMFQAMISRFSTEASRSGLLNGEGKFTPQQLLTMASIIQSEGDLKDFTKVSRVIRNRLAISMPLQLDSTVHYIRKVRGQVFLSTQATLAKSPYNTYRNYGLPPGPIGNPGRAAIDAAMHPEAGDWLFFITVAPGDTRFTKSNDEFLTWKRLYDKNRRAGAFEVKK